MAPEHRARRQPRHPRRCRRASRWTRPPGRRRLRRETGDLEAAARGEARGEARRPARRQRRRRAGIGFEGEDNAVLILHRDGRRRDVPRTSKRSSRRSSSRSCSCTSAEAVARLTRPSGGARVPLRLFTSESVTEGHPDKVADQISDAVLDAVLTDDPAGSRRLRDDGHDRSGHGHRRDHDARRTSTSPRRSAARSSASATTARAGFDGTTCGISVSIDPQSPDIAQGVDAAFEQREQGAESDPYGIQGAGDQGMMFGYATDETPSLMPLPIHLAHRMAERLAAVRKDGVLDYLRPDGKTQITVGYEDGVARSVDAVVVSTQHQPGVDLVSSSVRDRGARHPSAAPRRHRHVPDEGLHQPDGTLRDRRAGRRRGPDRPQDHRRHLRRHGAPRRRGVLRQGPVEGRPLRRLRDALGREAHRRGGPRAACGAPGRLRHRGREARLAQPRDVRDRAGRPGAHPRGRAARSSTSVPVRSSMRSSCVVPATAATAAYGHFGREGDRFTWERTTAWRHCVPRSVPEGGTDLGHRSHRAGRRRGRPAPPR
jgi:S-adenosylmethionine synthetase